MDKFRFENIKEKLKMKLEKIALENDGSERGAKRKYHFGTDSPTTNLALKRTKNQLNKETKTFIKVKRIVHAPKADSTQKNNLNAENTVATVPTNTISPKDDSISFEDLHKNVRAVKLPTKNWKIKMFMTENKKPLKIVFTNKDENERCVSFSYCSEGFVITFSGYTVSLLGAPKFVTSVDDISILLSIVDKISVIDPVLEYI